MTDVTMDKIVSLCRRRGFVFPSSEIYGGLGSTYDYGHYGVLMKNNIRSLWFRVDGAGARRHRRPRFRGHPQPRRSGRRPVTWRASATRSSTAAPASSASGPTGSRTRSAAKRPSKRPGEYSECDLTEARQFNLMFQTQVGAMEDASSTRVPPPRDGAGHLHQLQERDAARAAQAAVRHRADRQVVPQRDHARQLPLPRARVRADGDGVLRAARRGASAGTRTGSSSGSSGTSTSALRAFACCAFASTTRRSARTTRAARATSSTSTRSAGRSSRASRTAATST